MNLDAERLEELITEEALKYMSPEESLDLLLLVYEEKPAASVTVHFQRISEEFEELIEIFADEFDLYYLLKQQKDPYEPESDRINSSTVFLSSEKERLDMIKPLDEADNADKGLFLGYPEEAVEAFESSTGFMDAYREFEKASKREDVSEDEALEILDEASGKSYIELFEEKKQELIEDGKIEEERLQYLKLVSYVPVLKESGIIEAVKEGERRRKVILEKDDGVDTSTGKKILEDIL